MTSRRNRRSQAHLVACPSVVLLLSMSAWAVEEYPAPGYFLDGLSESSSWSEILAKPGIRADFPYLAFESTYVALSDVCVAGDTVAIANPRIDNGVRISADELRAQVQAANAGRAYGASAGGLLAAAQPVLPSNATMNDPVKVYKVVERGLLRDWIYLFDKPWPIPTCPVKCRRRVGDKPPRAAVSRARHRDARGA